MQQSKLQLYFCFILDNRITAAVFYILMLLWTSVDVIVFVKNLRSGLNILLARQLLRLVLPWRLKVKRGWLNILPFACHQEEWDLVGMPVSCWLAFKVQFAAWPLHVFQRMESLVGSSSHLNGQEAVEWTNYKETFKHPKTHKLDKSSYFQGKTTLYSVFPTGWEFTCGSGQGSVVQCVMSRFRINQTTLSAEESHSVHLSKNVNKSKSECL